MAKPKFKIEIYTADFDCPYCDRAKCLLDKLRLKYTEQVGKLPEGASTYPQIFIDDQLIGGCAELYDLHSKGFFIKDNRNSWLYQTQKQ